MELYLHFTFCFHSVVLIQYIKYFTLLCLILCKVHSQSPKLMNFFLLLQKNFAPMLKHLIKLDLSNNQLTELPDNFGELVNLRHLDLYNNQVPSLRFARWELHLLISWYSHIIYTHGFIRFYCEKFEGMIYMRFCGCVCHGQLILIFYLHSMNPQ